MMRQFGNWEHINGIGRRSGKTVSIYSYKVWIKCVFVIIISEKCWACRQLSEQTIYIIIVWFQAYHAGIIFQFQSHGWKNYLRLLETSILAWYLILYFLFFLTNRRRSLVWLLRLGKLPRLFFYHVRVAFLLLLLWGWGIGNVYDCS